MDIFEYSTKELHKVSKVIESENLTYGNKLEKIEFERKSDNFPIEIWRSKYFLCQVYEDNGSIRISINRTSINIKLKRWKDGISWDHLMKIKDQIGFGETLCLEIYPKNIDVVNSANIRHLWIPKDEINIGWTRK